MYADQQSTQGNAVLGSGSKLQQAYDRAPPPVTQSAMDEASSRMEEAISSAMSLAEMLAERLSPILRPSQPAPNQTSGGEKLQVACSPVVETINRQRSRVIAISAQLQDLLNRAEA